MKAISQGVCYFAITVSVLVGIITIYHMCVIIRCSDVDSATKVPWCHDIVATTSSTTVVEWPAQARGGDPVQLMEKLCRREVRHDERQHCVQLMLNRLVIATGFSSNHYYEGLNMIASVQTVMPEVKLIVYDLGMTSHQRATVLRMCGVELRTFDFTKYPQHVHDLFKYAWKPIIAYELVKDYEVVMWGDASVRLLKPLQEYILPYLLDIEVPFVGTKYNTPIVQMTHSGTLNYFIMTRESMQGVPTLQGGCWVLWSTKKMKELMSRWADCALHEECIAPKGAQLHNCSEKLLTASQEVDYCGCHRFDQSALNIILTQEFGKEVYKTVFEHNKTFEVKYTNKSRYSVRYCSNDKKQASM